MGLDMYLYKAKKISDKKIKEISGKDKEIIMAEINNLHLIKMDDGTDMEYTEMYKDIIPYCKKVKLITKFIDRGKIMKEGNIPEDWHCVCSCSSSAGYEYTYVPDEPHSENEKVTIRIGVEEMEEKYVYEELIAYYAVKLKEVGYWRKQYDLQDDLHEDYDGYIYNCGYHRVNENMYEDIMKHAHDDWGGLEKEIDKDDKLFYLEWY